MAEGGADPLFTLDVVRDFILSQDGKVSNHTLVTHFKTFLNDSNRKVANRLKFKEYVNALAVVKLDTSGEKLLVLKKKYRSSFTGADLAKPATAGAASSGKKDKPLDGAKYAKARQKQQKEKAAERAKALDQTGKSASEGDLTKSIDDEKENRIQTGSLECLLDVGASSTIAEELVAEITGTVESSETSMLSHDRFVSPTRNKDVLVGLEEPAVDVVPELVTQKPPEPTIVVSSDDIPTDVNMAQPEPTVMAQPDPTVTTASEKSKQDKSVKQAKTEHAAKDKNARKTEKRPLADADDMDSVFKQECNTLSAETPKRPTKSQSENPEEGVLSVRERAKHLNTIDPSTTGTSPVLRQHGASPLPSKPKRERESRRPEDSNYDFTLNEVEREWTIRSAYSDYQTMAKLLQTSPSLASRRDFLTGYTGLHWAAKNGSTDVIKLLFGSEQPPSVDLRSGGGYTPLHVAAMHGRVDVIELLIEVYGADANIRDYAGRRPKYYAPHNITPRAQQLLASRRDAQSSFVRSGSYSAKIGQAPLSASSSAYSRESWNTSPSPSSSPGPSSRKGSVNSDSGLMPPPRELPAVVRRRPVMSSSSGPGSRSSSASRDKGTHSDSEMHRAGSDGELHGSDSVPNIGSLV